MTDARDYYTLFVNHGDGAGWIIEFGDYSHAVVLAERTDLIAAGDVAKRQTVIACTDSDQESIDAYQAGMNGVKAKLTK